MNSSTADQLWFPCESGAPHIPVGRLCRWRRCPTLSGNEEYDKHQKIEYEKANLHFTFSRFVLKSSFKATCPYWGRKRTKQLPQFCLNLQCMIRQLELSWQMCLDLQIFGWFVHFFGARPLLSTDVCEVLPSKGSATHGSGKLDSQTWWFHSLMFWPLIQWMMKAEEKLLSCWNGMWI